MTLKLSLHGQELDGVLLDPQRMGEAGYVQEMVNELKRKHVVVLEKAFPIAPQIYIDGVQSGMNGGSQAHQGK
jgi:hypothetical protein